MQSWNLANDNHSMISLWVSSTFSAKVSPNLKCISSVRNMNTDVVAWWYILQIHRQQLWNIVHILDHNSWHIYPTQLYRTGNQLLALQTLLQIHKYRFTQGEYTNNCLVCTNQTKMCVRKFKAVNFEGKKIWVNPHPWRGYSYLELEVCIFFIFKNIYYSKNWN